jgi:hypothetical protein
LRMVGVGPGVKMDSQRSTIKDDMVKRRKFEGVAMSLLLAGAGAGAKSAVPLTRRIWSNGLAVSRYEPNRSKLWGPGRLETDVDNERP